MQILATDLDRTLLPNGKWQADAGAIELFNRLTTQHGVLVDGVADAIGASRCERSGAQARFRRWIVHLKGRLD